MALQNIIFVQKEIENLLQKKRKKNKIVGQKATFCGSSKCETKKEIIREKKSKGH